MQAQLDQAAPTAEESITFLRSSGVTPGDRAAGVADTPTYDPPGGATIQAIVNPVSLGTQAQAGGRVVTGDVVFQIRCSQLANPPRNADRVVWAGQTYEPLRITTARIQGAMFWVVRCSRR